MEQNITDIFKGVSVIKYSLEVLITPFAERLKLEDKIIGMYVCNEKSQPWQEILNYRATRRSCAGVEIVRMILWNEH